MLSGYTPYFSGQLTCPHPKVTAIFPALPILSSQLMTSLLFSPKRVGVVGGELKKIFPFSPHHCPAVVCPPPVSGNGLNPPSCSEARPPAVCWIRPLSVRLGSVCPSPVVPVTPWIGRA